MDSPPPSQLINDENEQLTPKKQVTPVQNTVTMRLKKLMSERQIQYNPDKSTEIDLSEDVDKFEDKQSPERLQRNASLKDWFRKRTPKASPANQKKKISLLKQELLERMKIQRQEEQQSRQRVFKADNEIFDEQIEDEEEFIDNASVGSNEDGSSDADVEGSGSESIEEKEEIVGNNGELRTQYDDEESLREADNSNASIDSNEEQSNDKSIESSSDVKESTEEQSNSNVDLVDKVSNSCNLSPFMDITNDAKSSSQPEVAFNKPTNFACLQVGNELHPTTSTISLHKTGSTPRIGSGHLLNEYPDSQSLDSQALASEMQHLLDEQQHSQITERDNYELLLGLTKLKQETKKAEGMPSSSDEDDEMETNVFKKAAKRKLQIESDDSDDEDVIPGDRTFPTTPSSGVTKLPKLADDLFQTDDGEDRLEMGAIKPFVDTVRVLFDDDDEEEEIEVQTEKPKQVESDKEDVSNEQIEDESVALRKQKHKWIDDEASLSGSEIDSDDEIENPEDNEYEDMDGDHDDLPDENEIREGIVKTHMRLQNIDEERRLNQLKEIFDNEINPGNTWDRSFRSRLLDNDLDLTTLVGDPLADAENTQSDHEEDEIISFKDHLAKQQAKNEEDNQLNLFTLASFADELSQDTADTKESSKSSKSANVFKHNPNGIAKFIVDNFCSQKEDSINP